MATTVPDINTALPDAEKGALMTLLDTLDANARTPRDRPIDQRVNARHRFRAECLVRFFATDQTTVEQTVGRTRNISRSGASVLVRRWFRAGDAVYVIVSMPGVHPMQLSGNVVFARRAHGPWFEVGVQFHARRDDDPLAPTSGEPASSAGGSSRNVSSPENDLQVLAAARAATSNSKDAKQAILYMATSSDETVRAKALEVLIDVGGEAAEKAVVRALHDEDKDVRVVAIGALGALGLKDAVDDLRTLLEDESAEVQLRAAALLGRFGEAAGLPLVEFALDQDDERAPLAAFAYGAIIGQKFRPNTEGVAAARRYRDAHQKAT